MHPASNLTPKTSDAAHRSTLLWREAFAQCWSRLRGTRVAAAIWLLLLLALPAFAADTDWHPLAGNYASFQAPSGMVRSKENLKTGGGLEIFESSTISLSFECGNGALSRELRTDVEKAIAYWATERRKNWRVNHYLEDDQHLAYAAIRTVDDPTFHDPRPYHLSFGFASGDKPFAIHFRFLRAEDLDAVERILKSIKLKTL
jgi:hypothetical protein